jgi:hypothetical protein
LGCEFIEASAKKNINIKKIFYDMMRFFMSQRQNIDTNFGDGLDENVREKFDI